MLWRESNKLEVDLLCYMEHVESKFTRQAKRVSDNYDVFLDYGFSVIRQ